MWSKYFGDDGYIKIARGKHDCGVSTDPAVALVPEKLQVGGGCLGLVGFSGWFRAACCCMAMGRMCAGAPWAAVLCVYGMRVRHVLHAFRAPRRGHGPQCSATDDGHVATQLVTVLRLSDMERAPN